VWVRKLIILFGMLFALLFQGHFSLYAQTLEGGVHGGVSVIGADGPLGTETGYEYGVWALLYPFSDKRWSFCGEWAYVPRDGYTATLDSYTIGESDRNRQYVDFTLQYHLREKRKTSFFIEGGGGALWNNSQIINPNGVPQFFPQGPQHVRKRMYTIGGGVRRRFNDHVSWVAEAKVHNLGRDERDGARFITGLVVGF
jgi:hypothetical protein